MDNILSNINLIDLDEEQYKTSQMMIEQLRKNKIKLLKESEVCCDVWCNCDTDDCDCDYECDDGNDCDCIW